MQTRIVVYDFDNTLFNSPNREVGENIFIEKTGDKLPFRGWWNKPESLNPPIVPQSPGPEWLISNVFEAYQVDASDPNTEIVLISGRPFSMKERILEICTTLGINFSRTYFRGQPGQQGLDPLDIKLNNFRRFVVNDDTKILEIWEDRPVHIQKLKELAPILKSENPLLEKVIIHDVMGKNFEI